MGSPPGHVLEQKPPVAQGFGEATGLARKMVNLYSLSSEQLSKQDSGTSHSGGRGEMLGRLLRHHMRGLYSWGFHGECLVLFVGCHYIKTPPQNKSVYLKLEHGSFAMKRGPGSFKKKVGYFLVQFLVVPGRGDFQQ